jgi:carbonic anhydrase
MSVTDRYLINNEAYRASGVHSTVPIANSPKVAIVSCMDARLDLYRIVGAAQGEAHIIRNAGGVVTEDVLRSLVISQRLLGTTEIVLIHHTQCGMLTFKDDELRAKLADEVGYKPPYPMHAFDSLEADVRAGMKIIATHPFLLHNAVRGFVFDIVTGQLLEVTP